MKNFLTIILNRFKTVGIDYLMEVIVGSVTEYRRARREGHFDTFRPTQNVHNKEQEKHNYHDYENQQE